MPALVVENLCKSFNFSTVLNRISFSLDSAEVLLLTGANGAGKSTLLSCIAGTLRFDSGNVVLGDSSAIKINNALGYAGDNLMLYEQLSVIENLQFWARIYGATESSLAKRIQQFGLQNFLSKPLKHCSLGMRRRVSLARSLLHDPQIVCWDEPFVGLDVKYKTVIQEVIEDSLKEGVSFIISSHEKLSFASGSSRSFVLQEGRLKEGVYSL